MTRNKHFRSVFAALLCAVLCPAVNVAPAMAAKVTQADIDRILTALDSGEYGAILRAKGIVPAADGQWLP